VAGIAALVVLSLGQLGQCQINARTAYNVKAAFLYSFGRYVAWPPQAFDGDDDPFVIGVVGTDPFGGALDQIAKLKKIQGRSIVVRRFASLGDYTPCHILFVPATTSSESQLAAIEKTASDHVLIVGESPSFASSGGVVNFQLSAGKVRFEINLTAAKRRELALDAKLLNLGIFVTD
jgi:hypothetical protein